MPPDGSFRPQGNFFRVITDAVRDMAEHGFDSQARLDHWIALIRQAAYATMVPLEVVDAELRGFLRQVYEREIAGGAILKRHPGVGTFTLQQVRPALHKELDKRIRASADLIKLHRETAVDDTLRRFAGWGSSIPAGGSRVVAKVDVKQGIRKSLSQLPFEARRVAIDQGHKFLSSLDAVLAHDANAIAAVWHSHWRQRGYNYREDHKERDEEVYVIRGCWALRDGLMKAGSAGYTDQITQPTEEVFCRCWYQYRYNLRDLPDGLLTMRGRKVLEESRVAA